MQSGDTPGAARLTVYTDGAYSMARAKGGYAFIVLEDKQKPKRFYKSIENSTNQRAEILAVMAFYRYLLGLEHKPKVDLFTDSMYVIGTTLHNWKQNSNLDLWKRYFNLYEKVKDLVTLHHVKGHAGNEYNEAVDLLAVISSL
jgi:ribonuclease HI